MFMRIFSKSSEKIKMFWFTDTGQILSVKIIIFENLLLHDHNSLFLNYLEIFTVNFLIFTHLQCFNHSLNFK